MCRGAWRGEQEALQHLVRTVAGQHPVGRHPPVDPPDRTRRQAPDLGVVTKRLQHAYPDAFPKSEMFVTPVSLIEEMTRQARPTFLILLGTVGTQAQVHPGACCPDCVPTVSCVPS